MAIETIGEMLDQGWRLHARCAFGRRDEMKSVPECTYSTKAPIVCTEPVV